MPPHLLWWLRVQQSHYWRSAFNTSRPLIFLLSGSGQGYRRSVFFFVAGNVVNAPHLGLRTLPDMGSCALPIHRSLNLGCSRHSAICSPDNCRRRSLLAVLPTSLHRTTWAILLAHIFFNISVVVRTVGPLWRSVDQGLIESAQTLGASPAQVYRHLLLPIARPTIISAGSLIFVMCFTSYGIIQILGGPGLATLDIEIYRRAVQLGDISGATVLGITQTLCIACAFAWWSRSQGAQFSKIGDRNSARALNRSSRIIIFLTTAAFTAPLGALIFLPCIPVIRGV